MKLKISNNYVGEMNSQHEDIMILHILCNFENHIHSILHIN